MPSLKTLVTRQRLEGLVILLVALVYLWEAKRIPSLFQSPGVPGPTAFPDVLGLVLAGCGLCLILSGWRGALAAGRDSPEDQGDRGQPPPRGASLWRALLGGWRFYAVWAIILGYLLFMPTLGFLVATPPALFGLFVLLGAKHRPAIGVALIATAAMYLCFGVGLRVQLPMGIVQSLIK